MKTKVMELLATKFEGVDSKILEGLATNLVKSKNITNDEEAETAVSGVTFSQVLQYHADKRAQEASDTARKNAISEYEKKFGLKDGKSLTPPAPAPVPPTPEPTPKPEPEPKPVPAPTHQPTPTPQPPQDNEGWLKYLKEINDARQKENEAHQRELAASAAVQKEMLETIKGLRNEFDGMKASRISATRRELLKKEIEGLTDAQKAPYSRISLDSMKDEEFNDFLTEVKSNVEQMAKEKKAMEASVSRPLGTGYVPANTTASKEELDELAKKMKL